MDGDRIALVSVNVGMPQVIGFTNGEDVLSGIGKHPVSTESVLVRATNIDGDAQADLSVHGGVDKAVYAYSNVHWPWWERRNLACASATFGENLTLAGVDETQVRIGDRFVWGDALLEISQPRAPCFKLGLHTGRPDAPQLMTVSAYCGWYLRVIAEGAAPARDGVLVRVAVGEGPTVRESFVALFSPKPERETLRRIHDAPALSEAWRHSIARKIADFGDEI